MNFELSKILSTNKPTILELEKSVICWKTWKRNPEKHPSDKLTEALKKQI